LDGISYKAKNHKNKEEVASYGDQNSVDKQGPVAHLTLGVKLEKVIPGNKLG